MTKEENEGIIQFIGINELSPEEQETVQELATKAHERITTILQNITELVVHIKTYENEGERKKYSLHVRCAAPSLMFESEKAHDWDLARVLHKAFNDIEQQIKHKLHTDSSRPDTK